MRYRAYRLKMIERNLVVDWIRTNEGEGKSTGFFDLESGTDSTYKQEEFSGVGRDPFLYYPFCLISCSCLHASFSS